MPAVIGQLHVVSQPHGVEQPHIGNTQGIQTLFDLLRKSQNDHPGNLPNVGLSNFGKQMVRETIDGETRSENKKWE